VEPINFLLVGVGGQGILTASDILAEFGLRSGYDVKKSEVHGMSQRGGAVSSHVRFGPRVYSPLIAQGEADFLLSFELLEALRWATFLRPAGTALVSTQRLPPIAVSSGGAHYPEPEEVRQELAGRSGRVLLVDAPRAAQELGNPRVTNIVLMGTLAALLPFPQAQWEETIRERMPARFVELNLQAFRVGQAQVKALA
jgi:indolepyruvate ferredoxin oxidoreductase beta subunit